MSKKPAKSNDARRILNRKARFQYHILETLEAGISLTGSEVKSLRAGHAKLDEAFVRINGYDVTLIGSQIDRYSHAGDRNHDPARKRPLLLHRREVLKLGPKLNQQGVTLVPLSIYFNARGLAKVELALVIGKRQYDKRQTLRQKDHRREMDRAMKRRS